MGCGSGAEPQQGKKADSGLEPDSGSVSSPFQGPVTWEMGEIAPRDLSDVAMLHWTGDTLLYNDGALTYSLVNTLFSDYTKKERAIWLPPDTQISWKDDGPLDFPVGTIISKTFMMGPDLRRPDEALRPLETRLLVKLDTGWEAWPYVWTEDGTRAELDVTGEVMSLSFIDPDGVSREAAYLVPQKNQCVECHEHRSPSGDRHLTLIGPQSRQLNRTVTTESGPQNQLTWWSDLGRLDGLPSIESLDAASSVTPFYSADLTDFSSEETTRAAREYLDINCAHCHSESAVEGQSSHLWLNHDNEDAFHLGICKRPGSAGEGTGGLTFDIVPGSPDESILFFRFSTENVGAMMPQIGRSLAHSSAQPLLRRWIEDMAPAHCSTDDASAP